MRRFLLSLPAVALASGCTYDAPPPNEPVFTGQSYAQAIQVMCDVDRLAAVSPEDDPLTADVLEKDGAGGLSP